MFTKYAASPKPLTILIAALAVCALAIPQSHARPVGNVAGKYLGAGKFEDHRDPNVTYVYAFKNIVMNVSSKGKFSGSAEVTTSYVAGGITTPYPGTVIPKVSGKVTSLKIAKDNITAEGHLIFSNGFSVEGVFHASAKSDRNGSFKAKFADDQFVAKFQLDKR